MCYRNESMALLRNSEVPWEEKQTFKTEQVGKGGLPPLLPNLSGRETAGVNHPSRLVQFVVSSCYLLGFYKQGNS